MTDRIVLAYSGRLDTSVAIGRLVAEARAEVVGAARRDQRRAALA